MGFWRIINREKECEKERGRVSERDGTKTIHMIAKFLVVRLCVSSMGWKNFCHKTDDEPTHSGAGFFYASLNNAIVVVSKDRVERVKEIRKFLRVKSSTMIRSLGMYEKLWIIINYISKPIFDACVWL